MVQQDTVIQSMYIPLPISDYRSMGLRIFSYTWMVLIVGTVNIPYMAPIWAWDSIAISHLSSIGFSERFGGAIIELCRGRITGPVSL